jgi:hypothetical protein
MMRAATKITPPIAQIGVLFLYARSQDCDFMTGIVIFRLRNDLIPDNKKKMDCACRFRRYIVRMPP